MLLILFILQCFSRSSLSLSRVYLFLGRVGLILVAVLIFLLSSVLPRDGENFVKCWNIIAQK